MSTLFVLGCGADPSGAPEDVQVGVVKDDLTGQLLVPNAAETQVNFSYNSWTQRTVATITYNDSDPLIIYPDVNSRYVYWGASHLGWSPYCTGCSNTDQKVRPPAGWAILWGDPAMTQSAADPNYLFISNLAVPQSRYTAPISGDMEAYIGGACIARSSDQGATFTVSSSDCVGIDSGHPTGQFYDGGSMTADACCGHDYIWAAFANITTSQIDVYMATSKTAAFVKLPNPFPGLKIRNHPRIRAQGGKLYVIALASPSANSASGDLMLNAYEGSLGWSTTPIRLAQNVSSYPYIDFGYDSNGVARTLRTGPQYSFDVGLNEQGVGQLRYAYTTFVNGGQHVHSGICDQNSLSCTQAGTWLTDQWGGNQFSPLIAYGRVNNTWSWKINVSSSDGRLLSIYQGNFFMSGGVAQPNFRLFIDGQTPCPDWRGYWGDYDDMRFFSAPQSAPTFWRTYTDSTSGTCVRGEYTSYPVNVAIAGVSP